MPGLLESWAAFADDLSTGLLDIGELEDLIEGLGRRLDEVFVTKRRRWYTQPVHIRKCPVEPQPTKSETSWVQASHLTIGAGGFRSVNNLGPRVGNTSRIANDVNDLEVDLRQAAQEQCRRNMLGSVNNYWLTRDFDDCSKQTGKDCLLYTSDAADE